MASTVKALYNETESLLLGRVSLVSCYGCNDDYHLIRDFFLLLQDIKCFNNVIALNDESYIIIAQNVIFIV